LKWKDQRTILLKLVSEVTDQDVISTDQRFSSLSEVLKEFSVDDLTAKAKKALKELNKRQAELPARIDEASKGLVQADFTECENQKADLEKQINDLAEQENSASKACEALTQINSVIMQKQFDLGELKRKANDNLMNQRREIQRRIDDAGYSFSDAIREYRRQKERFSKNRNFWKVTGLTEKCCLKIMKK
jgi:chromosome segregation ATPase